MELAEVAGFLVEASGTTAESAAFRPGWEDIFLINQQQLEGAVRRVSNDPNLEPTRKVRPLATTLHRSESLPDWLF
jgi:zinc finger-like protein